MAVVTMRLTVYTPGLANKCVGFSRILVEPSPKSQFQVIIGTDELVLAAVDKSVKVTYLHILEYAKSAVTTVGTITVDNEKLHPVTEVQTQV